VKSVSLARRVRNETTHAVKSAKKQLESGPEVLAAGLAKLRKGSVDVQKRLVRLRTQGARWLKKNPGRAAVGAFVLGVTVTKAARRG
jgi:hypothetical protein